MNFKLEVEGQGGAVKCVRESDDGTQWRRRWISSEMTTDLNGERRTISTGRETMDLTERETVDPTERETVDPTERETVDPKGERRRITTVEKKETID
ncbi:hypothetical protein YC2023_094132 [Brassica napus]